MSSPLRTIRRRINRNRDRELRILVEKMRTEKDRKRVAQILALVKTRFRRIVLRAILAGGAGGGVYFALGQLF